MSRFVTRLAILSILFSLTLPLNAQRGDPRFGAVDAFDNPAVAAQLGAGWTRLRFEWTEIQSNDPNQWNDARLEATVNAEIAAGREVAGLVLNTPPWARQDLHKVGVPLGMELPADDPQNVWAAFLHKLVSKYAGRVNHWIIWNEPDIWDDKYPGQTWSGSVDEYLQFQRIAYLAAKSANPNAMIHLAGFTYWWDVNYNRKPFFERFLNALRSDPNAASNHYYFDAVTVHQYFRPDSIYDLTAYHHTLMRENGFDKPVWIVETNAAPSLDPTWPAPGSRFQITLDEQGAFILQAFAMGIAAGAERIAVYKLADTPGDKAANPEPFGLVRMDGTRRPAFRAFQLASAYYAGFRSATLDRRDKVTQVTLDRGNQTTTVLWSRVGPAQKVTLKVRASSALIVDTRDGSAWTQSAKEGQYALDLPGASCSQPVDDVCLIGGWPILVIEQASGQPVAQLPATLPTSLPVTQATSKTIAPTLVSATPTATATPSPTATATPSHTPTPTATATATLSTTPTAAGTATATSTSTPSFTPTLTATATPNLAISSPEFDARAGLAIAGVLLVFLVASVLLARPTDHRAPSTDH